jgi:arylsulfatase A-like enzyme
LKAPRTLLVLLALTLLGLPALGCRPGAPEESEAPPSEPLHVLLISIDALRADRLGCYGHDRPTSPFLDELAARGVRYARAFVATHGTTPSHASLLSGLYQETHRVGFDTAAAAAVSRGIPEEVELLSETLRGHGYATLGVTDGGNIGGKFGFDQGWDVWNDRGGGVRKVVRRALTALDEELPRGRPVFLFLHTYEVHSPYEPPEGFHGRFGHLDSAFVPSSENLIRHAHAARTALSPADLEAVKARYDEGILFTDSVLRELFDELERRGFLERALVVLTADHGEELGEHGGLVHRDLLFEELIHVPLMVSGPGVPAGRVEEGLVSAVDVAPSILGFLGLPVPPAVQGRAALGLTGGSAGRRAVVAQYGDARYTLRTDRWKLIESFRPAESVELYDLAADPGETENVARRHPEVVESLRQALARWREAHPPLGAAGGGSEVVLSPEELERLRALGYVGPGR